MLTIQTIGKLRKQLGLTQKQLANLAGVSQSLIAKIESGHIDPAYSKVTQIFDALQHQKNKSQKTARDIMTRYIISVSATDKLEKAVSLMRSKNISQLPVFQNRRCVGSLSDSLIVDLIASSRVKLREVMVGEIMKESFPTIPSNSHSDIVSDLLKHYRAVLVQDNDKICGIITRADLFKVM